MENEKETPIYQEAMIQLGFTGKIDYESLKKEFGLEPKLASDGIHVRIMLDGTILFINPEDDSQWEEVDKAIKDHKEIMEHVYGKQE